MVTISEIEHLETQLRMMEDRLLRASTITEIERMQVVVRAMRKQLMRKRWCLYGN